MSIRSTSYGFATTVPWPQAEAIERTSAALKDEGFGILTTVDIQSALKEKLRVDLRPYVILGACNPPLAHRALEAEPEIGLLLPCNVAVYQSDGGTVVAAMDPEAALTLAGNPALKPIAREAGERLRRAMQRLSAEGARLSATDASSG
jgi:uncharacterized protein (DUF302 family)